MIDSCFPPPPPHQETRHFRIFKGWSSQHLASLFCFLLRRSTSLLWAHGLEQLAVLACPFLPWVLTVVKLGPALLALQQLLMLPSALWCKPLSQLCFFSWKRQMRVSCRVSSVHSFLTCSQGNGRGKHKESDLDELPASGRPCDITPARRRLVGSKPCFGQCSSAGMPSLVLWLGVVQWQWSPKQLPTIRWDPMGRLHQWSAGKTGVCGSTLLSPVYSERPCISSLVRRTFVF